MLSSPPCGFFEGMAGRPPPGNSFKLLHPCEVPHSTATISAGAQNLVGSEKAMGVWEDHRSSKKEEETIKQTTKSQRCTALLPKGAIVNDPEVTLRPFDNLKPANCYALSSRTARR